MKKFLSLVKLLLIEQYRTKPTDNRKKRRIGTIAIIILMVIGLAPMVVGMVVGSYFLGKLAGADEGICSLLILICQGLVLIFGTISVMTNVFNSKDADKLLYLPMSHTQIFLAKLASVYVTEVATTAATVLFALLPFGIGAHASVGFYLMFPVTLLLVPVLPLFVGCVFAMLLSVVMARLKNSGMLRTALQLVLFAGVIALYILGMQALNRLPDGSGDASDDIFVLLQSTIDSLRGTARKLAVIHPNYTLAIAMTTSTFGNWALCFIVTLVEHAALLGIVLLMSMPFYRWILTASLETGASRHKKNEQLVVRNRGSLRSLMITDLKRVMRNSQLGFQALGGLVVMPLVVVLMYFAFNQGTDDGPLLEMLVREPLYHAVAPLVIVAYMSLIGVGSNVLGLYPISRENNALYMLKILPVPFHKILLAKVLLSTSVMLVSDTVTCLVTVFMFGLHWYMLFPMLAVMALLGFGGMSVTTLLDLKSPKIGWTNFNQGLKNSRNSWIAMLIGALAMLVIAAISTVFVIWFVASLRVYTIVLLWIVLVGVSLAFAIVSYRLMSSKAATYFERIEP